MSVSSDRRQDRSISRDEVSRLLAQVRGTRVTAAVLGEQHLLTIDLTAAKAASTPGYRLELGSCAWRLESSREVVASIDDPADAQAGALAGLVGEVLQAVYAERPSLSTTFAFGDDVVLKTFSIFTREHEVFSLFMPDDQVLIAGPGSTWTLRAFARHPPA